MRAIFVAIFLAGCSPAESIEPEPTAPPTTGISAAQNEGSVVTLETAPRFLAGSGKAGIARLAQGENAFVGMLTLDPGVAVPEHQDETEEYIYVLEGGGTLTMAGTSHTLGEGSLVYMPAGITVSFQNGDSKLVALQVFAGPGPAKKYDGWQPVEPPAAP